MTCLTIERRDHMEKQLISKHSGCWILAGRSIIDKVVNVRILLMLESSRVGVMRGSSRVIKDERIKNVHN